MSSADAARGVMTEGTVLTVERVNVGSNGEQLHRVRYEYRDSTGMRHAGQSGYLTADEAQGWQPGDIGGVRYHDGDPAQSAWIGSLLPGSAGE